MGFESATMTRAQLEAALAQACRKPHKDIHKGKVLIAPEAYETPGKETNLCISPYAFLDLTGSIRIGAWCMFGARCRVYTHDHFHAGRKPLLLVQEQHGVVFQDKEIGHDVWLHDGAMVLYQVARVPDGVVLGAGAVLTKTPGPYEIWAGVPARKVGERSEDGETDIARILARKAFRL
ncbi:MAG: acyltransferase [Thermodesulfobacteriota bacterium]